MKKIFILAAAALISVSAFAQKKGDIFVEGYVALQASGYSNSTIHGEVKDKNSSFFAGLDIIPKAGYFVADNIAVTCGLGLDLTSQGVSCQIVPGAVYYYKLDKFCENLYWTPGAEVSATLTKGGAIAIGLNVGSVEYKVTDHLSLTADLLSLRHSFSSRKDVFPGDVVVKYNQSTTGILMSSSVGFRYNF